jgi:U3 small nucleolar ribonucleoprotein protein IMP4
MSSIGGGAIRRNARLRREYLYKKSLEGKAKDDYSRREQVRKALAEGKPIPTELRREAAEIHASLDLESGEAPTTHADDEYAQAGLRDPRVCITTSRDPSSRLRQFAAEVRLLFPNAQRINRGSTTSKAIVEAARDADFTDIILVQETRGEPDAMLISHLPFGPTVHFSLANAVLRHDIEGRAPVSEAYPHLVFQNFSTPLGKRIQTILTHLFPVPKEDSTRVLTFSNVSDFISFRHHVFVKSTSARTSKDIELTEVGPRFELRPFQVRLGTLDSKDSEQEWVLRPNMNTSRKRQALGEDAIVTAGISASAAAGGDFRIR